MGKYVGNGQWGKYRKKRIVRRWFGNLTLDELKKALEDPQIKHLKSKHDTYGNQIEVRIAEFDTGGLSMSVFDHQSKISYVIGGLTPSKFK